MDVVKFIFVVIFWTLKNIVFMIPLAGVIMLGQWLLSFTGLVNSPTWLGFILTDVVLGVCVTAGHLIRSYRIVRNNEDLNDDYLNRL